jgi:TonB-dependent SusC/RagA subfamily outer membrane receptor
MSNTFARARFLTISSVFPPRVSGAFVLVLAVSSGACATGYRLADVTLPDLDLAAPAGPGARLENADLERQNATSMTELLQGRLPGVLVRTGPGGTPYIQIRGQTSVMTDSEALIVVDGLESTASALLSMNPKDVARVEVLKDGSAAIYGMRAANGVLLITTRRDG